MFSRCQSDTQSAPCDVSTAEPSVGCHGEQEPGGCRINIPSMGFSAVASRDDDEDGVVSKNVIQIQGLAAVRQRCRQVIFLGASGLCLPPVVVQKYTP